MKYNILGRSNIKVSQLGFGSWAMGGDAWGPQNDNESKKALKRALDLGWNFIDTALSYGSGHSEKIIGEVLRETKSGAVLCTKVPPKNGKWGPRPYQDIDKAFPPEWIIECCHKSLRNLKVDCIDVLLLHTWNMSWSHRTEWFEAMTKLKKEGKIKSHGISVHDEFVSQANVHIEAGRVDVIEVVFNIFQQLPRYELFPLATKHNTGIIARAPLQAGILTGKYSRDSQFKRGDWRGKWTKSSWLSSNIDMLEKIRPILDSSVDIPLSIAALQFVLQENSVSVAIPGARSSTQVEQNHQATTTSPMPEDKIHALYDLWKTGEIHGTYLGSS